MDYIIKKHETVTDSSPIRIYMKKIKKKLHLKLRLDIVLSFWQQWHYVRGLEKVKDENSEHGPHLEITEVILVP